VIEFFRTLHEYRGILFYRTLASLRADARGMYLGYIWWFLEPVLNTALYYLIFGVLLGSKTPDFITYLLLGTVIYQWFQSSISGTMGTVAGRAHLYRQVPMPKYLFALIGIFSNSWKFLCVFGIIFGYVLFSTTSGFGIHLLWLPVLMLVQLIVIFGFAINFSIASAYIRDLQTFVSVLFRALMFLSGIFWDVNKVPENLELVFYSNPAASLIHCFRAVILYERAPNLNMLMYLMLLGLVLVQVGILWHRRINGHILKHIQA
jgi:lipopolysaccharide transport system permease protein